MALGQVLGLCLLCLGAAGVSANVQSDTASPELEKCQFSKKELHTTVRSAAVSALTGICDPVEMEDRLLGMEQRLKHKIEELKDTLTKLFIEGVAYDYDDESDAALEQHRYTGVTSSSTAAETSTSYTSGSAATGRSSGSGVDRASAARGDGATQTGANDAYNRIETATETRRRTSSTRSDSQRRTASSLAGAELGAGAGAGTAGSKTAGTQRGETRRGATNGYAYKWSGSSRSQSSSAGSNSAATGAGEARVEADRRSSSGATRKVQVGDTAGNRTTTATEGGASATRDAQRSGSRRSSSSTYAYRWSSSSGGSSGERSEERSRGEASLGVETSSREAAVEEEPGIHSSSRGSSSHRYSHERETSSRRSSVSVAGDNAQEARAIGADASNAVGAEYDTGKSGSRHYAYERRASSSSRVTTIGGSDGGAPKSRAIGGASHSERREEGRRRESSSSESRRRSQENRTSSQGSSREVAQRRAHESRAIGGTAQTRGDIPHTSDESYSSSHQYSHERGSTSRGSSSSDNEPPYVDFGPGGAPDQQSWFPGTSRTTAGTGVPDLPSASTSRVGGVGFGAVGEPLEEDSSSGRSSGAQVRAGGGAYAVGDGSVVFRNKQRYADSPEARRPGSTAGGDNSQYAATNSSWSSSGERQVTAYDASSASRPDGTNVRFLTSYAATQDERAGAYVPYSGQQSRSSSRHRSRHSSSRSRANRRRVTARRRSRVVDTVSSVSGAESAPLSRYLEINKYNDTVYEENGKQMYSYYWEVNDFPTMMSTWEHQHSLKSPSFYVFRGGYRMYIRVFPSRQGGNVYLHTGLTQGRYDDQLTWPFQMRLRLSLLDHSNLQHDIRSRIWDPRRLCSRWNWQRPRRTDNFECVGLGFPQSLLETQRFLLDDAVLIKLDVFLDD